jgi:hypothetical protein
MKYLFSANTPADYGSLDLLKGAIEEAGMRCLVRNELLGAGKGDIPAQDCIPELWILNDDDYTKAKQIMEQWKAASTEPHAEWVCQNCKETSEGQFSSCWKCGKERQDA